jgi:hypothetical protein
MCNLVNVDRNGMATISPEVIVKGFKKCCITNAVDENYDMLWNCSEEDEVVRSVRKKKALTVKMEQVTLIGKGGQNLQCSVY